MDLLSHIWQIYLYQPLVNLLVYLYSTVAGQNLGWAVVALTVSLRVVLLPLSIVEGRNEIVIEKMQEDVAIAEKHFRADPMYMKEHIRLLMRKNKIRPWAKTLSLAIQLLVLVLLYQVFITGISGAQLSKILYSFVEYPGRLNTLFFSYQYGSTPKDFIAFDVGQRSLFWAALVGVVLVVDIIFKMKKLNQKATGGDLTYLIMFPLASFAILWYLPMVKSLFIFTSMMISYLLIIIQKAFWGKDDHGHGGHGDAHGGGHGGGHGDVHAAPAAASHGADRHGHTKTASHGAAHGASHDTHGKSAHH